MIKDNKMKTSSDNKDHQSSKSKQGGSVPQAHPGIGAGVHNSSSKSKTKVLLPPPSNAVSRLPNNSGSSKNENNKGNLIANSKNSNNSIISNASRFLQFVGPECGHHASYTFYKAIKYVKNGQTSILGLGEFFFVKIYPNSDLVAIGELQLLWEDRNTNQILSSLRLYFLPEYTPEGRTQYHGEDEVVSVAEKAVLRVSDLLDWITNPKDIEWDRGILGVCHEDCISTPMRHNSSSQNNSSLKSSQNTKMEKSSSNCGQRSPTSPSNESSTEDERTSKKDVSETEEELKENGGKFPLLPGGVKAPYDNSLDARFSPAHSEFLADIKKEKEKIGDIKNIDGLAVIILSHSQYGRYRAVLKRISGREKEWMNNSLIVALGGFTTPTRRTYVLFCRDNFDYAELEEHPYLCNHLAPKLKGRPRKRKNNLRSARTGSPAESEASSESSTSTSISISAPKLSSRNGMKKDLLGMLRQKSTKEELDFLKKLISFMERRNTPIERPPMLGFKQIDLHAFFEKVAKLGGYDGCVHGKAWKSVYDDLGGNPQNTSAATCTRRHYEKFLLPYERHTRGREEKRKLKLKAKGFSDHDKDGERHSPLSNSEYSPGSNRHSRRSQGASSPLALDMKNRGIDIDDVDDDSPTLSEKDGTLYNKDGSRVEPDYRSDSPMDTTKTRNERKMSGEAPKKNPLLTPGLQTLMDSKQDSHMRIDPDGKRLQIDDLTIIPYNSLSGATGTEGTGSALQNLAKIASRYQNIPSVGHIPGLLLPPLVPGGTSSSLVGLPSLSPAKSGDPQVMDVDPPIRRRSGSSDTQSPNLAKKPRIDYSNSHSTGKGHVPPETKQGSANLSAAQLQLQQTLLGMFPPNLLAGLPPSLLSGTTGASPLQTQHKGGGGIGNNPSIKTNLGASASGSNSSGRAATVVASNSTPKEKPQSDTLNVSNANNAMQLLAACSMAGLPPFPLPSDLSQLGPEGLNLLQMYEKHLRQIATSMTGGPLGGTGAVESNILKNGNTSSLSGGGRISSLASTSGTKKEISNQSSQSQRFSSPNAHGGLSSSSLGPSQSILHSPKEKDRSKVCKPPPDTKRPPSLMQTPCAFKQTTSIYTNPLAELTKAREAAAANSSSSTSSSHVTNQTSLLSSSNSALHSNPLGGSQTMSPLDLTSTPRKGIIYSNKSTSSPSPSPKNASGSGIVLNLKKESSLLKPGAIGSSGQENSSSSASSQPMMDLAAALQLDPSKLDPATAALHSQLTQQLAANPHLLNPSNPAYLGLAGLGLPQSSSSASAGTSAAVKNEAKVSPFSAEALLSKPSPTKAHLGASMSSYHDLLGLSKSNSAHSKAHYPSSIESSNFHNERRVSNASPSPAHSTTNSVASAKLAAAEAHAAAQANAAALAFGLPMRASSTQPPRQSPSSSALAVASSSSHSPSSTNTDKSHRTAVSPWHMNLTSTASTTITPSPKHVEALAAPSSKQPPPLTANPTAAAAALLDKLGLDKLGIDKQTLLKDTTFQSALLNLGIPPSLLGAVTSSSNSLVMPPSTTISSHAYAPSSLTITPNYTTAPTMSGLSHHAPPPQPPTTFSLTSNYGSLQNTASSLASLSNPYLALMTGSSGSVPSQYSAGSAAGPSKSASAYNAATAALMDPATSAYYAALYSQQMFGAAGLNPYSGLPAGSGMRGAAPPTTYAALDPLQAASLQSMMGGARPSGSSSAAASAAAMAQAMAAAATNPGISSANPFGAYAGLSGLSGFPGLGGFPPGRRDT